MSARKPNDPRPDHTPDPANPDSAPDASWQDDAHPDTGDVSPDQAPADWATLLTEAQEKVSSYHEELLRARAEVENIRRRAQDEVAKARKFGIESFAESLVPVKDSLEAALAQPEQDLSTWKEGVEATLRQLVTAFDRN